jgi:hypothetical protein
MKNVHLVIPDLFLPRGAAAEACAGLHLPALGKLLARVQREALQADTLEAWLCTAFGVADMAIAPVTLLADGLQAGEGYWLRADPVHLHIQRDQLILQAEVPLNADEAVRLCAALNAHFSADGMHFIAPHPQRWYLRTDAVPDMIAHTLAQVTGRDIHAHLPQGADALRWHGVLNEIQMLLFEHPVNEARETRGELPINSVWLWGGGRVPENLKQPFARICSDSDLAAAFAQAANIPCGALPDDAMQCAAGDGGDVLIVWDGLRRALQCGDLAAWRMSLLEFEQRIAAPLLGALRAGQVNTITLDVLQAHNARRFVLHRNDAWKFWRRPRRLDSYSQGSAE